MESNRDFSKGPIPVGFNIVVRGDVKKLKTAGGILHTADTYTREPDMGTVLQIGSQCESGVAPGDRVLLREYTAETCRYKVTLGDYIVCDETEVLAILPSDVD